MHTSIIIQEEPWITKKLIQIQKKISLLTENNLFLGSGMGQIKHYNTCQLVNIIPSQTILSLVLQGEKILQKKTPTKGCEKNIVYPKGSIVLFPAGKSVSCVNSLAQDACYLAATISFSDDILLQAKQRIPESLPNNPQNYKLLLESIATFLDFLTKYPDPTLAMMQQEQILYFLCACGIHPFSLQNSLVSRIRAMVETSPSEPWTTALLAHHFAMSERSLRRHLQKSGYGCTELIRLSRMHVGLSLLQKGNMRVGEIANYCGYESSSRFSERFRDQFHISPIEILHGEKSGRTA